MFFVIALVFICIIFSILIFKFDIVPHYCFFVSIFAFSMGFFLTGNDYYWLAYLVLILLFTSASSIPYKHYIRHYTENVYLIPKRKYTFNQIMFWIVILLITYHYLKGGIPIFSSNVGFSRFDNTSSGLFGIPGRMALFGRYFILFYAFYFYIHSDSFAEYKKYKKYFWISIVVNIVYAIFSGSKSSIFALIYTLVYVISFHKRRFNIKKFMKPKLFIGIGILTAVAFYYFYYLFVRYNNQFSSMGFMEYFFYRLTNMTVESGSYALRECTKKIYYYEDFIYYIQKYFHINLVNVQSLEVYVSNAINHIQFTNAYAFYVPVTMGLIPETIYHFGILSPIIIIFMGYFFGYYFVKIKRETHPIKYMRYCFFIYFFVDLILKGCLMYHIINYCLMLILMKAFELVGKGKI